MSRSALGQRRQSRGKAAEPWWHRIYRYPQAFDVAAIALYDINKVVRIAVLPEEDLGIVDLVLLRTTTNFAINPLRLGLAFKEVTESH